MPAAARMPFSIRLRACPGLFTSRIRGVAPHSNDDKHSRKSFWPQQPDATAPHQDPCPEFFHLPPPARECLESSCLMAAWVPESAAASACASVGWR